MYGTQYAHKTRIKNLDANVLAFSENLAVTQLINTCTVMVSFPLLNRNQEP